MTTPDDSAAQAELERLRGEGYEIVGPIPAEDTSERDAGGPEGWQVSIVGPEGRAKSWSGSGPTADDAIRAALAQVEDTTSHAAELRDVPRRD